MFDRLEEGRGKRDKDRTNEQENKRKKEALEQRENRCLLKLQKGNNILSEIRSNPPPRIVHKIVNLPIRFLQALR